MDTQNMLDEWENRYQAQKTGWDRGQTSPALTYWLESGELNPCRILVPGCGNGYEVLSLAQRGFEVVGVDIAPTPIANLRQALAEEQLQAEALETDLLIWQPDTVFDAIYEQTCLCALQPQQWLAYEQKLFDWLKPGGRVLTQFMQTHREGGPPFHCAIADMQTLFSEARWQWVDQANIIKHPSGSIEEIQVLLIKRS